ncbi:MAG TPA: C-GCAxxG-C-C family protein [Anaeromyxobacter sp.]|jgi:C_GCAxxG_C_C family probable redox protein|nr:C-GCAxxG-C-C family protein [Anaeromyxobacter sp.]
MHSAAVDRAVSLFDQGFTCAQAVLAAFAARHGLDEPTALKVACAYGGGIARSGEMCGAVSGALMVIGLAHGKASLADDSAKERTYALTREFWKRFREQQRSLVCKELIGVDIGTPSGAKMAAESGVFREKCPGLVRCAAQILEELLAGG